MAWKYRDIATFPAIFPSALRNGLANLDTAILVNTYSSEGSCRDDAEFFRWYRYCLRQKPDFDRELGNIACNYKLRTKILRFASGYGLYLTVSPTPLSELEALNPDLLASLA